jgi:branched-subunit amino acid transport protein
MTPVVVWPIILAMGLVTYALRVSMIAVFGRIEIPVLLRRASRFVPAAVLAAFVAPELLRPGGTLMLSLASPRLVAGVVASVVAWRSRSVSLTVAAGMALLWLLQAVR